MVTFSHHVTGKYVWIIMIKGITRPQAAGYPQKTLNAPRVREYKPQQINRLKSKNYFVDLVSFR